MFNSLDKGYEWAIKEPKESMRTMSPQIENINKEVDIYLKTKQIMWSWKYSWSEKVTGGAQERFQQQRKDSAN